MFVRVPSIRNEGPSSAVAGEVGQGVIAYFVCGAGEESSEDFYAIVGA